MALVKKPVGRWTQQRPLEIEVCGHRLLKESYGALSQDERDPLSRVSVANSSFSCDPFRGCPLRCAYCTVTSVARDVDCSRADSGFPFSHRSRPDLLFPGRQLAEALMTHPAFIPDKSIVSIGTASTEAFLPHVERHTWGIMRAFLKAGLKNPFWIVMKSGVREGLADRWAVRINKLVAHGNPVVLSVSYSGCPPEIEPYQGDRFRGIRKLKAAGARISLHLRPVLAGINDSRSCLERALDAGLDVIENVCAGGLRRDLGVEIAWTHINGLDPNWLPQDRQKFLPDGYLERVQQHLADRNVSIPVFLRSSEALSHLLGVPDYNLHAFRGSDDGFSLRIPAPIQRSVYGACHLNLEAAIEQIASEIGLPGLKVVRDGDRFMLAQPLSYPEERALIHAIGHSGILSRRSMHVA